MKTSFAEQQYRTQIRSGQVRSGNLISPLARVYFVAPSKGKKINKIQLKVSVKLMNKIMQNQPTLDDKSIPISNLLTWCLSGPKLFLYLDFEEMVW